MEGFESRALDIDAGKSNLGLGLRHRDMAGLICWFCSKLTRVRGPELRMGLRLRVTMRVGVQYGL